MASQTTAAVTGRFVCKLKTQREDESQDKLDECFAIAEQREVGRACRVMEVGGLGQRFQPKEPQVLILG